MSSVWDITKLFCRMFLLQAKPSEVPYSSGLLLFVSLIFIVSKIIIYLFLIHIVDKFDPKDIIDVTYFGSALVSIVWLLILLASLRSALLYFNLIGRFVQSATSFVAMDCILNLIYLLWLGLLAVFPLPATGPQSIVSIALILGFVLIMYWQFMVYIHLVLYSLDITILKAGIFTLFYMLLQHNLAELLLNSVITVTEL